MEKSFDVVVVGGAAIGAATAYFLTRDTDARVAVIERDPTYRQAATVLSAGSLRLQFSTALNVRMSAFGRAFLEKFPVAMAVAGPGPDVGFHAGGYLFLAATHAQVERLRINAAVQIAAGAATTLMSPDQIAAAFPHLRTSDVTLGSYGGAAEGWFDGATMLAGLRARAKAQGAVFLHDEVVGLDHGKQRIVSVTLAQCGRLACGAVVNAAGCRAARIAEMAGIVLPIEPRKRTVFAFDCQVSPQGTAQVNEGRLPLMIDSTGVYCRPEGGGFIAGATPLPDPPVDPDDLEPRYSEFEEVIWPALAARSQAFEAIRLRSMWAGQYDWNVLDRNAIIGAHPDLDNLFFANGFSGHGLQHSPAVGRGLSEMIGGGGYRTLDLSELGWGRVLERRGLVEQAVI